MGNANYQLRAVRVLSDISAYFDFLTVLFSVFYCSCGVVGQSVERPSKDTRLVQLYWRGFDSRLHHEVVGRQKSGLSPAICARSLLLKDIVASFIKLISCSYFSQ